MDSQSQSQLRELYEAAQKESKKQRDAGFKGRVLLPGEGSFEDFVALNSQPLVSTGLSTGLSTGGLRDLQVPSGFTTGNNNMSEAKIDTDIKLLDEMSKQAGGLSGTKDVTGVLIDTDDVATQIKDVSLGETSPQVAASTVDTTNEALTVSPGQKPGNNVGQIDSTAKVQNKLAEQTLDPAQITKNISVDFTDGSLSEGAIAEAATIEGAEFDARATVKHQMADLMAGIEEGKPLPPWASPAVRKIAGVMQSRGLGSSSIASAAMTQAVLESGIPIAAKDADQYAKIQLANLNNRQRTALQNAAAQASMDTANLNARLKASVTNAQLLLATETKNMDAQQQTSVIEYQALTQAMFKDAAEENARKQFNAKNELQVEEFFAELESQVETANANRVAAMEQFNAGQTNSVNQFNASMRDSRDKFNTNMKFAVDQSNAQWRREVNTANTAIQNETNRLNVQNALNISQSALNNLWQMYRDNAAWNFQKSESQMQRQHEIGIMAMEFANTNSMYEKQQKDNLAMGIGNWLALWAGGTTDNSDDDED